MYQVIAKHKNQIGHNVQVYYIAKTYKSKKNAEKFIEKQKHHPKFYFEIQVA